MASFLNRLNDFIQRTPDKTALEFIDPPEQKATYRELGELVQASMAYLIRQGLQPGDRVALQLPKSLEFISLHLATIQLGAISLPLNPAYPPEETSYFLRDSGASLFFAPENTLTQLIPHLPELPDLQKCIALDPTQPDQYKILISGAAPAASDLPIIEEDQTAVIIYTSGTTGHPKGAEITHGNLQANLEALHKAWGWRPEDILLHALPIFHVHGLFVALHGALNAGATILMTRQFEPGATLRALIQRKCTVFMGVPTIHRRLLEAPGAAGYDLSKMRLITSGSDRLPDEVYYGFQQTFGYTLLERYGLSETGMNLSNPLNGEHRIGSVGLPLPGVEARVVNPETNAMVPDGEVGEVQIRGPNVFKGYWRQLEKTAEAFTPDGWFRTGDLGLRQSDGYFTLRGRAKDLIITGGLNVYPPEVERVLGEQPAISASAVIGCPDEEWGERVVAVVVLKENQSVSAEDLIAYCREHLAPYKTPKMITFAAQLPQNAMGKVQKGILREEVCS